MISDYINSGKHKTVFYPAETARRIGALHKADGRFLGDQTNFEKKAPGSTQKAWLITI